jgi:hypothetical protein
MTQMCNDVDVYVKTLAKPNFFFIVSSKERAKSGNQHVF